MGQIGINCRSVDIIVIVSSNHSSIWRPSALQILQDSQAIYMPGGKRKIVNISNILNTIIENNPFEKEEDILEINCMAK